MTRIHDRLIANQSLEELERKNNKARRKPAIWTQEAIDLVKRRGERLATYFKTKEEIPDV
jgi:hypothetical protein